MPLATTFPTVTLLYGSLTALLVTALGANVSRTRGATKTFVGDTPDAGLTRVIRSHGNAAEWAPLLLFMLLLVEMAGAGSLMLHVLGGTIFGARLVHAVGVLTKSPLSVLGAGLTYLLGFFLGGYGLYLHFMMR